MTPEHDLGVDGALSSGRHLVSQSGALATGRIGAACLSAVWFVVAARHLSLAEFGSLALLLSLGLMLTIVADLGLSMLLSGAVAARPDVARDATLLVIRKRLPWAALAATVTGLAYAVAGGREALAVSLLFGISTIATAVYSSFTATFRAQRHAAYDGANELVSRVVVLGCGWAVLQAGGGLVGAVATYAAVDVGSLVVLSFVFVSSTRGRHGHVDPEALSLRRAATLGGAGVVGTVYSRLDTWLVALLRGDTAVARYGAAYRVFDGLLLPATAVSALSIPHVSGSEGFELRRRLMRLASLATITTLPLALGAFAFSDELLDLVFGGKYAASSGALQILAIAAIPSAVVLALLPPIALRSVRAVVALGVALVANLVANLLLVPSYAGTGAAWATLGCQLLLAGWLIGESGRLCAPQSTRAATGLPVSSSIRSSATRASSAVDSGTVI